MGLFWLTVSLRVLYSQPCLSVSLFGSQSRCEYYTHSLTCSRYKAANLSFIFETRLCPACSRYKTVSLLLFHGYLSHLCGFVSYSALQDSVFSYLFCSGLSIFLLSYYLPRTFILLLYSNGPLRLSCLLLSLVFSYLLSSLIFVPDICFLAPLLSDAPLVSRDVRAQCPPTPEPRRVLLRPSTSSRCSCSFSQIVYIALKIVYCSLSTPTWALSSPSM